MIQRITFTLWIPDDWILIKEIIPKNEIKYLRK